MKRLKKRMRKTDSAVIAASCSGNRCLVPDRTTVVSKLVIRLSGLPLAWCFVLAVVSQIAILLISLLALSITGSGAVTMSTRIPISRNGTGGALTG